MIELRRGRGSGPLNGDYVDDANSGRTHQAGRPNSRFDMRILPRAPAWTELALCATLTSAGADALFFAHTGGVSKETQRMCASCPVQPDCLEAGRTELNGVWGGLTTPQRNELFGQPKRVVLHPPTSFREAASA